MARFVCFCQTLLAKEVEIKFCFENIVSDLSVGTSVNDFGANLRNVSKMHSRVDKIYFAERWYGQASLFCSARTAVSALSQIGGSKTFW